jgi:AraC family transcriptional regulator
MSGSVSSLEKPRIVQERALRIVGLAERHVGNAGIPAQWSRFLPHLATIPARVGSDTFGVMYDYDESGQHLTYLSGVLVSALPERLGPLSALELPARSYAVWPHRGHVSGVARTCQQIFAHGLADAGLAPLREPLFERYGEAFDASSGSGGLEIWVPVAR